MSFGKKWKQKQEIGTVQFLDAYCIHNEDWRDYEKNSKFDIELC